MVRLLVLAGLFLCYSWPTEKKISAGVKRIFIGVDGVSREEFDHAREKLGLFRELGHVRTHISPFPSISDYSWNVMVHAQDVFGKRGSIKTYEAAHYDREKNELVTDPREYFRRLSEDHHYFTGAFEHWLNPYVESLLYIPTEELPRLELKQLLSAVKEDPSELVTVMVASSDALAHTRADGSKFLFELDKFIRDIKNHYDSKGIHAEIILASDHGQASRFLPGEESRPLLGVNLKDVLKRSGLRATNSLRESDEVAMPVMALANYGTAFFKDLKRREAFIRELKKEKWFSLSFSKIEMNPYEIKLSLSDQNGDAELHIKKSDNYEYYYEVKTSNVLEVSEDAQNRWLTDEESRLLFNGSEFPDAFYRIAFSAFEEEAEFPDLLFTLKDEFYLAGNLDSFTTMYQTHGSLSKRSSSGIVASTHPIDSGHDELRTKEVLPVLNIDPQDLFASTEKKVLPAPKGEVATGSDDWDNRRVFALMGRVVQESRYVFDGKSFDVILNVVKPLLTKEGPSLPEVNWKEAMTLTDVAHLVDLMLKNGNIEKVKTDARFIQIKNRLSASEIKSSRSPSAETMPWDSHIHISKADAAKKIVMKSYSSMFLLEKALMLPELPHIKDERNLTIDPKTRDFALAFAETFKERSLMKKVFPQKIPVHWEPILPPGNVTLVYVPGIYNSLFDDEIFRSGLDQLKHKWGVRIISPKVFSTCSSSVNGKIILDELKHDFATQMSLGRNPPSYFIVGYSKGGVDSLHSFASDPAFVSRHVHGLLSIASPIGGTSILNKSDLPLEIMQLLGHEKAPVICKTEEKASKSITPSAAQTFLRKNSNALVGLTRYYSLSFASDIDSSHLFMRATKNIARFGEPNDGVVALSASRFPAEFQAVDLGIVKADHLSGIVASHFPQDAFFESVLFTLGRMSAFDQDKNKFFNEKIAYESKLTSPERHRVALKNYIGSLKSGDVSSEAIIDALKNTSYAVKPFSLLKKDGVLNLSFNDSLFSGGSTVPLESPEKIYDYLLISLQSSGRNLLKASRIKVPETNRVPAATPVNELGYEEDLRLNIRKLEDFISGKRVVPVTYLTHPQGFSFVYDHASSTEFRNEYQLSFEETAPPEADDHPQSGWETILRGNEVWAKLSSFNSSIRLSTYSWRFLAADYPELDFEIQVNDDVEGADVLYGGSGKDDSAFQLWFTFRIIDEGKNREYLHADEKMMTIGYYFGDEIPGEKLKLNEFYPNYYSEKDFIVAKLPPAKQKLIGIGKEMMGKPLITKHNLLDDIRASYPSVDAHKAEIVGITIQHDSNDTKGKSEALFRSLKIRPALQRTVKAD